MQPPFVKAMWHFDRGLVSHSHIHFSTSLSSTSLFCVFLPGSKEGMCVSCPGVALVAVDLISKVNNNVEGARNILICRCASCCCCSQLSLACKAGNGKDVTYTVICRNIFWPKDIINHFPSSQEEAASDERNINSPTVELTLVLTLIRHARLADILLWKVYATHHHSANI